MADAALQMVTDELVWNDVDRLLEYRDEPYRVTLTQLETELVYNAPFPDERKRLFAHLSLYLEVVWSIWPQAVIWIDGSFVSLMEDRAPNDVDLVIVVRDGNAEERRQAASRGLLTMSDVRFSVNGIELPSRSKLQPYGGMIDAYYLNAAVQADVEQRWEDWTTPRTEDGQPDFSRQKGFLEVRNND